VPRRAFGRIRQLPSGRWQARIADPDGRLQSLGTYATRTAANRALSAHETDAARGAWTARQASTQTLETYAAQWLETRALRPRTKEHYADQLRLRILPTLGPVPLSSLTPQRIRVWHAASGRAPNSWAVVDPRSERATACCGRSSARPSRTA
jgi:hypothetical protein